MISQKNKERIGDGVFIIGGIALGVGNLIFILYCIGHFFNSVFGKGAGVPATLMYLFANVALIFIITEVLDWSLEERGDC